MGSLLDFEWEENLLGAEEISVDDEIKGTGEIFMSKHTAKTEEEINQLCSKDGLNEIERIAYIMRFGVSIQKRNILQSFVQLSKSDLRDGLREKVIPICLEFMNSEPIPFQIKLGEVLLDIIPTLSPEQARAIFMVAKNIVFHKVEEMARTWKEVFLVCVNKIPDEDIRNEVIPEAAIDGGLSQPVQQRIWSGRILGAVVSRLDARKIEQLIFPRVSQLSQDTDYEVRKAMCKEMATIMKYVGLRVSKRTIFSDYLDLLMDEEINVQESAFDNLMMLSDLMDAETKIAVFIPAWKRICSEDNQKSTKLTLKAAELFGQFLWKVKNELSDHDKYIFLAFYQTVCGSNDVFVRRFCAYNLPAVVTVFKPQNFGSFKLDKIVKKFVNDEDSQVQLTMACCFHEIALMLSNASYKYLSEPLAVLLNSDDELILHSIYKNLKDTLYCFNIDYDPSVNPNPKQASYFLLAAYMEAILNNIIETRKMFEAAPNIGWRLHEQVLKAYECFLSIFDEDKIFETCVQPIYKILLNPYPNLIKREAIKILVLYLRQCKKSDHHESILRLLLDIKDDKSCHIRILYFDICEEVIIQFSQKFFRSYLFYGYLGLSRDLIPNIRIRFVSILHLVRHCLRIPVDNPLLSKLIDATEALAVRDSDAGVMLSMNQFHAKYGLLHTPECCQRPKVTQDPELFSIETVQTATLKQSSSVASLTDKYLLDSLAWESLANNEQDRIKEEAEHKQLFFQLDPGKKKDAIIRNISIRREYKRSSSVTPSSVTKKASNFAKERRISSSVDKPVNVFLEKPINTPLLTVTKRDEKDVHLPPLPQYFKEMSISPSTSTSEDGEIVKVGGILSAIDSRKTQVATHRPLPQQPSLLTPSPNIIKRQAKSAGPGIKLPSATK